MTPRRCITVTCAAPSRMQHSLLLSTINKHEAEKQAARFSRRTGESVSLYGGLCHLFCATWFIICYKDEVGDTNKTHYHRPVLCVLN